MEKPQTSQSFPNDRSNLQWAIAVANLDGRAYLSVIHLGTADIGEGVFKEIRKQLRLDPNTNRGGGWTTRFFTKIVIGTAKVHETLTYDLEQRAYCQVNLEEEKDDPLLTEAFHNPKLLFRETQYIADKHQLAIDANSSNERLSGQNVILIRRVLHKRLIAWVLIVLLLISPGLGIAIGMCLNRLDVGVAVSAGIFALASFLLALAKWFQE